MKKIPIICFTLIVLISAGTLSAQFPAGGAARGRGQNMNMGHLYGKVIDSATNKAIDAASVQLIQSKMDTATKKKKDVIVSGMLTTKKGEFSFLLNSPFLVTRVGLLMKIRGKISTPPILN